MSEQNNQVLYVFQNSRDAAVLKCAVLTIGYGRPDLAKDMLAAAKIDATRLSEMQMRATQVQSQGVKHGIGR